MIARGFGTGAVLMLLVLLLFSIARLIGGRSPGDLTKRQQRARISASKRDVARIEQAHQRRLDAIHQPDLIPGLVAPDAPGADGDDGTVRLP